MANFFPRRLIQNDEETTNEKFKDAAFTTSPNVPLLPLFVPFLSLLTISTRTTFTLLDLETDLRHRSEIHADRYLLVPLARPALSGR